MKYRQLGKTELQISEIGHGTWAMGGMWGARDDQEALAALRKGFERGINFIDTAFIYGNGHSERLISQVLKDVPHPVYVATKCPPKVMDWPPKPENPVQEVFPADHIRKMTETSLQNLGVDCLDLQQFHVWRDEWLEADEWKEAVRALKEEGKIRYFGVSLNDHAPDSGLRLVKSGLVDTVQVIFNLFDQSGRDKLFPECIRQQVGVIARVPFDEGGLTGKLSPDTKFAKGDWRSHYFSKDRLVETIKRAEDFSFLLQGEYQTLPQAALKFCLSEDAVSTVIPGMRTSGHVEENTVVSEFPDFSAEDLSRAHALSWPRSFYPSFG